MKDKLITMIAIVTILALMVTSFVFERQWEIFWGLWYIILIAGWLLYGILVLIKLIAKTTTSTVIKIFRK